MRRLCSGRTSGENTVAETTIPSMRYTKTFKKYTSEFEAPVVEHVRIWAKADKSIVFYEDKSIVKVTSTQARIAALLEELKTRFNYIPPEERETKSAEDAPEDG